MKLSTFAPPAFDANALRLFGDTRSRNVARVVQSRILASFTPPLFDVEALRTIGERHLEAVARAVHAGVLSRRAPSWSDARPAFDRVFGSDRPHHLFRARPFAWAKFSEPQMTRGLAHFVNEAPGATGVARARALLAGLDVRPAESVRSLAVTAEALVGRRRRIDLLIVWEEPDGRRAVAVEAKFGHTVTRDQLLGYRTWLGRRHGGLKHLDLVLLTGSATRGVQTALERNKSWRGVGWRSFLLAHERALPTEQDDEEYRRFRRTLWARAG